MSNNEIRVVEPEVGRWDGLAHLEAVAREEYRDWLFGRKKHHLVDIALEDDELTGTLYVALLDAQTQLRVSQQYLPSLSRDVVNRTLEAVAEAIGEAERVWNARGQ